MSAGEQGAATEAGNTNDAMLRGLDAVIAAVSTAGVRTAKRQGSGGRTTGGVCHTTRGSTPAEFDSGGHPDSSRTDPAYAPSRPDCRRERAPIVCPCDWERQGLWRR